MGEKNGMHSATDQYNSKTRVKRKWRGGLSERAELEADLVHSVGDLPLLPAQHHGPERPGCSERAAHHLRTDEECNLKVAERPKPLDCCELWAEIGGV